MNLRIRRYLAAMIIAFLFGPVIAYAFQAFFPAIMQHYSGSVVAMGYVSSVMRLLAVFPVSAVAAVWLFRAAGQEGKSRVLWAVFGAFFQVAGVAVFYAFIAYQRSSRQTSPHR